MESGGVRSVIEAFDGAAVGPLRDRMRALLDASRPDVRYLVARVSGAGASGIASLCAAVLAAAGAPTGRLDGQPRLPTGPLDDALYARAGRLVLSAVHQLGLQRPELGQPSRREAEVLLALIAFAEASLRVVLLVEERPAADPALGVVDADIAILGRLTADEVDAVLAALPDGRPLVAAPQDPEVRSRVESVTGSRGLPALLGGRDFTSEDGDLTSDVIVAGERYAGLPRAAGGDGWILATGVCAALGVGMLGIRMRPEWVVMGAREAARRTIER